MVRLKNVADSPRGIYALSGLEMFSPGEERDVDLSPGERASLGSYFRVVTAEAAQEAPAKAPEPVKAEYAHPELDNHAENNIDHLRAIAEDAGVKVDRRWSESRLRAEIEKAQA
jgi:hypothetical protein